MFRETLSLMVCTLALFAPQLAQAQDANPVIIVTAPGDDADADDAIKIDRRALGRAGAPSLLGSASREVAGVSLSNAQGNPYQPNLIYRGFSASPLQGNAQGLAVYVDGVRFNQPFGDTVNFDLLPDSAIESITIKDASPVYGLNALGGAVVLATKTGKSAPGVNIYGALGDYGRREGGGEAGWSRGDYSGYVALQTRREDGWRRFSPSKLTTGFADLGWDGARAGLHIKFSGADSDLTGNGTSPVELLAADFRAVFTFPDQTINRFHRVSLHPWVAIGEHSRLEASLYGQWLQQRTLNGDAADIEECEDIEGFLCLGNTANGDENPVRDEQGTVISDTLGGEGYGVLNRSRTVTSSNGALIQFVDKRPLLGGENELIVGFSLDRSRTRFAASTELGVLTPERSVTGLGQVIVQPDGAVAPVGLRTTTQYTGLFVAESLPLGPNLTAEIGLRWNEARVKLIDQIGTRLNGDHLFRRLNPGFELDYRMTPALTLRAGYAETNRAPTPAELSCADEDAPCSLTNFFVGDPPLEQVVAQSWEAGASGRIAGPWAVQWQVSAYRTNSRNDIQFIASTTRGRAFFQNMGATRRQGIELSASMGRGPLSLRAGYAFTDATYRSVLVLNSPDNPSAAADGKITVMPGNRIPSIPRHRGVFSVDYETDRFTLGGDVQAQSGQYLHGDEINREAQVPGFAVVNLRGSVRLVGKVSLFAEVNNFFDRRFATFGTFSETEEVELAEAPGASNPRSLTPGAPRRWLVGVKAQF